MPAEDGYLRQLIEESKGIKTKPLPGMGSLAWNHPGVLGYGIDSQAEWNEDQRHAYILGKLAERYPDAHASLPPHVAHEVEAFRNGERTDLTTPYHYRGVFTAGAPLHNLFQGMATVPALMYAGSAKLANAVDPVAPYDPDADKKWNSALNTLTGYGAEAVGLVPKGTKTFADVAAEASDERGNAAARWEADMPLQAWRDKVQADAANKVNDMYIDGPEHFQRAGVSRVPSLFMGAATDAIMDPYNGLGNAVRIAKSGAPLKALWGLVKEFGFNQGAAGLAASRGP